MSIVIKEIILSDTLEKLVEKVNFNFDQLMLAGGGPPGPIGPQGLPGPAGPQGQRGTDWFVGCTGTTISIGASLLDGDLFLATGCTTTWPKGNVYVWDEIGMTFDYTGLNLVGPTGPTGAAGANTGWSTYEGTTAVNRWALTGTPTLPGPTSNFILLRGDTDFIGSGYPNVVAGITSEYSRDVLWLGGKRGAELGLNKWPLDKHPKIFISPRKIRSSLDYALTGIAGSGIALGNEPENPSGAWNNSNSFSNIFIDDDFNLRITNFTDFPQAAATSIGVDDNNISIESMNDIILLGKGYSSKSTAQMYTHIGPGATWSVFPDTTISSAGAIVLSTVDTNNTTIRLETRGSNEAQTVIAGGRSTTGMRPNTLFTNMSNAAVDTRYLIAVRPSADQIYFGESNIDEDIRKHTGYIQGGIHLTGPNRYPYISIGDGDTTSADNWSLASYRGSIIIDSRSLSLVTDINNFVVDYPNSLSVEGRIRMEDTAPGGGATGYFMVNDEDDGRGIWVEPNRHIRDHFVEGVTSDPYSVAAFNSGGTAIYGASGPFNNYALRYKGGLSGEGLQYTDGTEGVDKFLKSDANGFATWSELTPRTKVTIYDVPGTYAHTIDTRTVTVDFTVVAGGGGGGSGSKRALSNNSFAFGGGGGGAGGYTQKTLTASEIVDLNLSVTVGAGGAGGITPSIAGNINGSAGFGGQFSVIQNSTLSQFVQAQGGIGGGAGKQFFGLASLGFQQNIGLGSNGQIFGGAPGYGSVDEEPVGQDSASTFLGTLWARTWLRTLNDLSAAAGQVWINYKGGQGGGYKMFTPIDNTNAYIIYNDTPGTIGTDEIATTSRNAPNSYRVPTGGGAGGGEWRNGPGTYFPVDGGNGGGIFGTLNLSGGVGGGAQTVGAIGNTKGDTYPGTGGGGSGRNDNAGPFATFDKPGGDGIRGSGGGGGGAATRATGTNNPGYSGGRGGDGFVIIVEHF